MSSGRISVFNSKELQGVILLMKGVDREIAKQIRRVTKPMVQAEWGKAIAERTSTRLEARVLADTARVAVSDQNVTLKSAGIGRKLSGGLLPSQSYAAVEFGADRSTRRGYDATNKQGTSYTVNRRTRMQLRPRKASGYVVFPAAAEVIPRLASLWVQTVVRTFHEQIEKR